MRKLIAAALMSALATPVLANDTTAQLGAGGLIFVRSDTVAMESEDLFISPDAVRVAYVFKNLSEKDVDSIVAFPMPDIQSTPYAEVSIPDRASDNFLDFKVTVDGKAIEPALDQRAFAAEVDVTDELKAADIPLFPYAEGVDEALDKLPEAQRNDWIARGIIIIDTYDDGAGMKDHYAPIWTLKSTYWWRTVFPAGKPVDVKHSYKPGVGGTVGLTFVTDGSVGGPTRDEYRAKYCMDGAFERTVQKAVDGAEEGTSPYYENWISYVLVTGGNWASNIGKFKLTIDKGSPDSLVSFCGEGVRKIGPTTFEMTATDFYPSKNIEVLILKKPENQ